MTEGTAGIRVLNQGANVSSLFSADGTRLFVADESGKLTTYDVATGAAIGAWQVGIKLGGMDITPDGKSLVVVEQQPLSVINYVDGYSSTSAIYKIDIATGTNTSFTTNIPRGALLTNFHDIVALADGNVLISQDSNGSGYFPLKRLNITTGVFSDSVSSYSEESVFTRSAEYSRILFGEGNISDAPLAVLDGSGNRIAGRGLYADGVSGFNWGGQAISGSGGLIAQSVGGLYIYDSSLNYVRNLSLLHPQLGGSNGLVFSPDGSKLYVLDAKASSVTEVSTVSFEITRSFLLQPYSGQSSSASFGDSLHISADGRYLSVFGSHSLQLVDLGAVVNTAATNGDDYILGDESDNVLAGFAGNDVLDGLGGGDRMYGGAGNDRYYVNSAWDQVIEQPGEGFDEIYTTVDIFLPYDVEKLVAVEGFAIGLSAFVGDAILVGNNENNNLSGSNGSDVLIGGGGDDYFDGGAFDQKADMMYGGAGNDFAFIRSAGDLFFENPGEGTDSIVTYVDLYMWANVENARLSSGVFIVGNELANDIRGNANTNLLIGGAGDDTIYGRPGNDSLFGEGDNDKLFGDAGVDYLVGGAGNDTLNGGDDADALYGEDGDDLLDGGNTFDTDILVGGSGNDTLDGGSGLGDYDLMDGGAGDDSYQVDTPNDLTFEATGGGTDTVYASIDGAGYYLYADTENLVLEGITPFGVGNALNNNLTGNAIGNYLLGGAGNDTLNGVGGNDVLFGEGGADTFVFDRFTGGDVIGDFQAGVDKISLSGLGFANYAQLQPNIFQVGGNTGINLGQGDFIVLNGVTNAQLSATDFLFG